MNRRELLEAAAYFLPAGAAVGIRLKSSDSKKTPSSPHAKAKASLFEKMVEWDEIAPGEGYYIAAWHGQWRNPEDRCNVHLYPEVKQEGQDEPFTDSVAHGLSWGKTGRQAATRIYIRLIDKAGEVLKAKREYAMSIEDHMDAISHEQAQSEDK